MRRTWKEGRRPGLWPLGRVRSILPDRRVSLVLVFFPLVIFSVLDMR